jgi:3-phenylpropionate/trans-cinnamate dioxygenase ferredoxin subunit
MSDWIRVASCDELSPGQRRSLELEDTDVLVLNVGGEYFAVEDLCSHDGSSLTEGELDADELICPHHGARFCVRDGRALTPPAYEDIRCFPIEVRDGAVYVRDDS